MTKHNAEFSYDMIIWIDKRIVGTKQKLATLGWFSVSWSTVAISP